MEHLIVISLFVLLIYFIVKSVNNKKKANNYKQSWYNVEQQYFVTHNLLQSSDKRIQNYKKYLIKLSKKHKELVLKYDALKEIYDISHKNSLLD